MYQFISVSVYVATTMMGPVHSDFTFVGYTFHFKHAMRSRVLMLQHELPGDNVGADEEE